jgi:hypothetical protein
MKSVLLCLLLMILISGCTATQSKNVENVVVKPTPPSSNSYEEAIKSLIPPTPLPTPAATPDGIQSPIKDLDYTVVKFDKSKMKKTTLDTQPIEIVRGTVFSAFDETKESDPKSYWETMKLVKRTKIKVLNRDFNYDGIDERIILSRGETGEEVESFDVFKLVDGKWDSIFSLEGDPDYPQIMDIEFLVNPNKTGSDLIKEIFKDGDEKEVFGQINYYQMLNGEKYERVECRELPENGGGIVPPGSVNCS